MYGVVSMTGIGIVQTVKQLLDTATRIEYIG